MTLDIQSIRQVLTTVWLAQTLHYEPGVTSTNDLLKGMAQRGEPAGTALLTDYQSQGKGRLHRRWDAPAGTSLLFSILFRPDWPVDRANWLTMIAGLAATKAIKATTGVETTLKWPNDIVTAKKGRIKKLGGILTESEIDHDRIKWLILGMGLNVNIAAGQLPDVSTPATSLTIEARRLVSREQLFVGLILELERLYAKAEYGHSPLAAWQEQLITIGRRVKVERPGQLTTVEGYAEGINEWGHLLVRDDKRILYTISAGDVTLSG